MKHFGGAYRARLSETVHDPAVGAASVSALAGGDNAISPFDHVPQIGCAREDPDHNDLAGYLIEPEPGQISAAKYKLAQRADEQARLFPELQEEIEHKRRSLKTVARGQTSKKHKDETCAKV